MELLKIFAVDFDGVIHSYTSGWQGPRNIPDPPVEGAILWLEEMINESGMEVHIFSSRLRYWGAKKAIKDWLLKYAMYPSLVAKLKFSHKKPPAHVLLDDRCLQFDGRFPSAEAIRQFHPWNRVPLSEKAQQGKL